VRLKVGSKVTIMYKMKADAIEVKATQAGGDSKPAATKEQKKK